TNDDQVVSLSKLIMKNPANPNTNPLCGTDVYISNVQTGQNIKVKVTDTCANCTKTDIVVSKGVFQTMAKPRQGVVKNVTWYLMGDLVQPSTVGNSGSGNPEYGDTGTASATPFGGGTGANTAAYSTGVSTAAGVLSTG
ncbi:MAG: hypothetical protein Q9214_005809, partial [Letrouitia sp. 1 TL-2023]